MQVERSRDNRGKCFEPQIISKYDRNAEGMEEKIIGLYACGLSQRDIAEQIKALYDVEISPELVSKMPQWFWRRLQNGRELPVVRRPTIPGCNFSEKFENMIRFCMEDKNASEKRLKDLEAQCARERKRQEELMAMNSELYSIIMNENIRQDVNHQPACDLSEQYEDMIHFCAENEDAINARKRVRDLETQCAGERKRLKELRVMNNKLYSIKCMMNQAHAEAEGLN